MIVYQDSDLLPRSQWASIIGCSQTAVHSASIRGRVRIQTKGRSPHKHGARLTPIADAPQIVDGFAKAKPYSNDKPTYPWAIGVDTTHDFEVQIPSGAKLIYEYPKG